MVKKRLSQLLGVAALLALVGGAMALRSAWDAAALREAYLPDLEERGRREAFNGPALALLAVRRCEARQYGAAGLDWERAAGAGERGAMFWRTWAATVAASGDRLKARAVLQMGIARDPKVASPLSDALKNLDALPPDAPPAATADAIFLEGVKQASDYYGRGSLWNGYFSWRGRRDPEHSGFATRQEWAAAEPANPAAQKCWAEALLTNERYGEAEAILRKCVAVTPDDPDLQAALGDALRGQNRQGEAGKAYQKSLHLAKENRRALLGLGRAMLDKSLVRVSVPLFEKATRLYPADADAWIGMGRASYQQRLNFGGAISAFEHARTLAPERTDFSLIYASSLRGAGRYADAEAVTRQRIAVASDDAAAHALLASLLLQTQPTGERRATAEQELRESLRLADNPAVKGRLGQFLVEQNRGAEAIPFLEAALGADNKNISHLRSLAAAFRQAGQAGQAKTVMQSLADLTEYRSQLQKLEDQQMLRPDDVEVHRQMAILLERGGEMDKAAFHREAVRRLKANPALAKQTLTQIGAAMSRSFGQ